eukprot:NODE_874_length_3525_cov_0.208990.p3 type:complete len:212 gc:universal NODE_874_length_3525_cov_0.208990:1279-1914(+)
MLLVTLTNLAWQEQYSRMNGTFFGVKITDEQFVAVFNPLLVVMMVYFLASVVYPLFEKRGIKIGPLLRMSIGAVLITLSFFLSAILESRVDAEFHGYIDEETKRFVCSPGKCLHAAWQIPQWILLNLGESFFSPTGNEFAYQYAGKSMKSTSSSFWLLLVTLGNFMVVLVEEAVKPYNLTKAQNLYVFSVISAVSNVLLIFVCLRFKGKPQ